MNEDDEPKEFRQFKIELTVEVDTDDDLDKVLQAIKDGVQGDPDILFCDWHTLGENIVDVKGNVLRKVWGR